MVERDKAAKGRNLSLYPEQEAVLVQTAKEFGLGTMSGALRFVIVDWVRLRRLEWERTQRGHGDAGTRGDGDDGDGHEAVRAG